MVLEEELAREESSIVLLVWHIIFEILILPCRRIYVALQYCTHRSVADEATMDQSLGKIP
jgi:hypothetical protein